MNIFFSFIFYVEFLFSLREHLGPLPIFRVADLISFRSGFLFCFCLFLCLRLVSCIPYDASFSVLSIIDCPLCFLYRLVSDDERDKYCNQTCEDMIYAISFFARQYFFFSFVSKVFRQIVGILMGTSCAHFLLYRYYSHFMAELDKTLLGTHLFH